jgi:hypothetical protein
VLELFVWLDRSPLGLFMKDHPAAFATIEAVHLMGLVVLGGSVLLADLRLLGLVLREVPLPTVGEQTDRWFVRGLCVLFATGVPMLSAVAQSCYRNPFYWTKMGALLVGIVFTFAVRRPLLHEVGPLHPWTCRLVALASLGIWFLVAASGRWIGFS